MPDSLKIILWLLEISLVSLLFPSSAANGRKPVKTLLISDFFGVENWLDQTLKLVEAKTPFLIAQKRDHNQLLDSYIQVTENLEKLIRENGDLQERFGKEQRENRRNKERNAQLEQLQK